MEKFIIWLRQIQNTSDWYIFLIEKLETIFKVKMVNVKYFLRLLLYS